ncbi:MAG: single-stranded DNA-binding protein [Elusimicrobia bacterium]|nr:single-stranded DNA-binding protein [Elusimicrobiota bacterium]
MATQIRLPEINFVVLSGRLTRDPELRFLASGKATASFGLASNRRFLNKTTNEWQDDATFVNIVVWDEAAQRVKDRLHKGSPVFVEGRLKFRQWDAPDGAKKSILEVVARRVQFLEAQGAVSGQETAQPAAQAAQGNGGRPKEPAADDSASAPLDRVSGTELRPEAAADVFGAPETQEVNDLEGVAL